MASGDFLELSQRAAYLARRDTSVTTDITRAKEAINEAYLSTIDGSVQYDFLVKQGTQAMVVGQEAYTYTTIGTTLSITVNKVIGLGQGPTATNQGDSPDLKYASWEDYWGIKALNLGLANGVASIWTSIEDASILVWPKPSAVTALTVIATQLPVELASDAATPIMPISWRHRVLVPYAAAILLKQESGSEAEALAERLMQEHRAAVAEMRAAHELPAPIPAPSPSEMLLPSALRGAAGSYLELAQRVCYATGKRPWMAHDLLRAKEAVNECYQRLMDDGTQWDFLTNETTFSTVNAQAAYTFTAINANCTQPLSLTVDSTGLVLNYLEYTDFKRLAQTGGVLTGSPEVWTKYGDSTVLLYPTPNAIISIKALYRRSATALAADADVTLLPSASWAQRVIVPCAASQLSVQGQGESNADTGRFNSQYEQEVALLRASHTNQMDFLPVKQESIHLPSAMRGAAGTFLGLAQAVCEVSGVTDWYAHDLDRAKSYINEAYLYVCQSGQPWRFLEVENTFTTTANADVYTYTALATAMGITGEITDIQMLTNDTDGGIPLKPLPWEALERVTFTTQDNDSTGAPTMWAEWDNRIRLSPEPDGVYTIGVKLRYQPLVMSANADEPVIPKSWRERLLVPYAAARMLQEKSPNNTNSIGFSDRRKAEFETAFTQFANQYGSARVPRVGLEDESWNRDWPGSIEYDLWPQ